jgi:ribonuclease HI
LQLLHKGCYTERAVENLFEDAVNLLTDGSSKPSPRRGGIGFIVITFDQDGTPVIDEHSPNGYPGATNNHMELMAVVEGIRWIMRPARFDLAAYRRVVVFTDSMYIFENLNRALFGWSKQRWNRSGGAPALNADLWRTLNNLRKRAPVPIQFEWTRGKKSPYTKRVDKLAKNSAERPFNRPLTTPALSRKLSAESTDPGSVPMRGDALEIRIIEAQRLSLQRRWRYRYEVLGGDLEGAVDWATSDLLVHRYTRYIARFNDEQANPRIEAIEFSEKLDRASAS